MRLDDRRMILCAVGTRPEVIKMAPVIEALRAESAVECIVVATGQHGALLQPLLEHFKLVPDVELPVATAGRSMGELMRGMGCGLDLVFQALRPNLVLAAGDTCSALAAALGSQRWNVPLGHVEAGLRTHDLRAPYPEEPNRVLIARLAALHFAPTPLAERHLLDEGVVAESIHVTGNPVIDALQGAVSTTMFEPPAVRPRRLLVTAHRRENLGGPLLEICRAVQALANQHPEIEIRWPLHPNPAVRLLVREQLGGMPGVKLGPALEYPEFVEALSRADLVLTDSGGIQEEAPALGKPVLVLRDTTERIEAVEAGVARLVGTTAERIEREVAHLLTDEDAYRRMSRRVSPYGDGQASGRIAEICLRFLDGREPTVHQAA